MSCWFIYIMFDPSRRIRKVGISNAPADRRQWLERERRCSITLEWTLKTEHAPFVEMRAHRALRSAGRHIQGEWFRASLEHCVAAIEGRPVEAAPPRQRQPMRSASTHAAT